MSSLFNKFTLTDARCDTSLLICAVLLWCVVVACAISSIFSQPFNKRQRVFWVALVIGVPLVGVLAYIPFSFRLEDMPHIFLRKSKRSGRRDEKTSVASK